MFSLIQDYDGHWYVIPSKKRKETEEYFREVDKYWEEMPEDKDEPETPDWLDPVGGSPGLVEFEDYTIK